MTDIFNDDEVRGHLRHQGVPPHLIERAVATRRGGLLQPLPAGNPPELGRFNCAGEYVMPRSEADDARDEKRVVAACDKQLRALGFRVINTSQPRHAKFITPGVPDRFYFHRARGVAFCWEAKTATGEQSPAQRDFQEDCEASGWTYLVGTDQVVYDWLVAQGIAFEEGGLLVPLPYRSPESKSA